jgi:hypothetical protein
VSEVPKLDRRDSKNLMEEIKNLAKQYTPEWSFEENSSDVGVIFAKIFCGMMESTISRYNKTSYNYYLTFLNTIGTKLRPASEASGMVVVTVTEGSKGAYIEKGAPVFADADTEDGVAIYETKDSLFAVDTNIDSVFFTDGLSNSICGVYSMKGEENEKVGSFRIFDNVSYENLQHHEFYFGDDVVFDVKKSDITFFFYNSMSEKREKALLEIFSDKDNVKWQYNSKDGWQDIPKAEKVDGGLKLQFESGTVQSKINEITSRFIRCKFNKLPDESISVTKIKYKSACENLPPDTMYSGDAELTPTDFFPFEEQYSMYSNFAFACKEAFTKKGADIEINVEMQFVKAAINSDASNAGKRYKYIMTDMDFANLEPSDVRIEKVAWEYWNGKGWARLVPDHTGEDFFNLEEGKKIKRKLKFKCPDDLGSVMVGSGEGFFIRVRISKMNNQFDIFANYITPYIHNIFVSYDYGEGGNICDKAIVHSDLREEIFDINQNKEIKLAQKTLCECPAMYLCLTKPLREGTIRLFVNIEEGIHRYNPTLKWEYCANDNKGGSKWEHIDVMDLTDGFSHSETVTMIGKNDFKKITLFNKTGYFIRILNPDMKYSNNDNISSRPVINDIKFNAVEVVQNDTRQPEYFSIDYDEENKLCKLSSQNASNVVVWVDEFGKLSTVEQEKFLDPTNKDVQPEYNETGALERIWVKWKPVPNLVSFGINDRVYEVDYPKGEILFGNGRHGKIPTAQYNESIKITYAICNGGKGNVDAGAIKGFVNNIQNVNSVTNASPIMGGVDMESVDNAAKRMFEQISSGNRLVTLSDFEDSIKFNDRNIYKIKCLSHIDEDNNPCIGITSIAVLPREYMQGYEKFQGIKNRIWKFIDEKAHAPLSVSTRLRIFEVRYVETSIGVDVVINDFNDYQSVHQSIKKKLKNFLDPVTGNFSQKGWNIGEFPRKELIYNCIKAVGNIKFIKNINIFTYMVTKEGKKELSVDKIKQQNFVVPIFGEPKINIAVG